MKKLHFIYRKWEFFPILLLCISIGLPFLKNLSLFWLNMADWMQVNIFSSSLNPTKMTLQRDKTKVKTHRNTENWRRYERTHLRCQQNIGSWKADGQVVTFRQAEADERYLFAVREARIKTNNAAKHQCLRIWRCQLLLKVRKSVRLNNRNRVG